MNIIVMALGYILNIAQYAIFISVVMSWIPQARGSKFASILSLLTEPILGPIRKVLDKALSGKNIPIDFSPLVAILIIGLLESVLRRI